MWSPQGLNEVQIQSWDHWRFYFSCETVCGLICICYLGQSGQSRLNCNYFFTLFRETFFLFFISVSLLLHCWNILSKSTCILVSVVCNTYPPTIHVAECYKMTFYPRSLVHIYNPSWYNFKHIQCILVFPTLKWILKIPTYCTKLGCSAKPP